MRIEYENGIYEGDVDAEGKRHGQGVFIFKNGDRYVGEWKNDHCTGTGVMCCSVNREEFRYEGELEDEIANGHGTVFFPDGTRCEGEWKKGTTVGVAKCSYSGGTYYEGACLYGKPHGSGILYYANKTVMYEGEFQNDEFNGNGKLYRENGALMYEGEFKEGYFHGFGTFYLKYGGYYEGEWDMGLRHGSGTAYGISASQEYSGNWSLDEKVYDYDSDQCDDYFCYDLPDGTYYEGELVSGLPTGNGTQYGENDRIIYDGSWAGGKYHGYGGLFFADGSQYRGKWHLGEPEEGGRYYYPDGSYYVGETLNYIPNGKGTHYGKNREILFTGEFENGSPVNR